MLTVDHPNIVKYLETYSDKNHFYLVMEKCSGGNLFDTREKPLKNGKRFTED
jgi:calcium-dependent protein kinase